MLNSTLVHIQESSSRLKLRNSQPLPKRSDDTQGKQGIPGAIFLGVLREQQQYETCNAYPIAYIRHCSFRKLTFVRLNHPRSDLKTSTSFIFFGGSGGINLLIYTTPKYIHVYSHRLSEFASASYSILACLTHLA